MTDLAALKKVNLARWNAMKIEPHAEPMFVHVAQRLVASKARYQIVSTTGVPWAVIAVIHERESSQSWKASLAQGDPWDRVSIHVPRGRGPFQSWEAAACDALINCAPYAAKNTDWTVGGALVILEEYNGLGYEHGPVDAKGHRYPPQASPYNWAGTDQYTKGKYIADGHFDPDAVDHQLGCAGLLKAMIKLDQSITFADETSA
jgi:lysozyme family protein